MPLGTNFNVQNVVDPASSLTNILGNLQGQVGDYEKQKFIEQQQKDILRQQALENLKAGELLKIQQAQEERAKNEAESRAFTEQGIANILTNPSIEDKRGALKTLQGNKLFTPNVQEASLLGTLLTPPKPKEISGTVTITSPDNKRVTSIPYSQLSAYEKQGWLLGKNITTDSTKGSNIKLISEDPKYIEDLNSMATSFLTPRSKERASINTLANDADVLQQLTGTNPDTLIKRLPDVLSTKGIAGIGHDYIDKDKVNEIFKNRSVVLGNKSIPIGQAMEILRVEDIDGNKKYTITKNEKGKVFMDVNPNFDSKKSIIPEKETNLENILSVLPSTPALNPVATGYNIYKTLTK